MNLAIITTMVSGFSSFEDLRSRQFVDELNHLDTQKNCETNDGPAPRRRLIALRYGKG